MSFLGGIGGSLFSSISQIALGAMTGGMSLIAQFALQIASQVAQQFIQQFGQQLGLPQGAIDTALQAFSEASGLPLSNQGIGGAVGEAAQQFGGSPTQQAELENQANDALDQLITTAGQSASGSEETSEGSGEGDSFLVALAKALGKVLDGKMTRMKELSEQMNQVGDSSQSQLGSLSGELNAVGQEVGILSNALKSSIETLGRAQADLAKKQ
jgi:hypothetical protein